MVDEESMGALSLGCNVDSMDVDSVDRHNIVDSGYYT